MKRFFALVLVLSLVLSLCACKKKEPEVVPTAPTETTETESPNVAPPVQEIVPEIEDIPTMPSAIPDDTPGLELLEIYSNFLYTYDWSQYNGFISEAPGAQFTYILSEGAELRETKLLDEDYEGALTDRLVEYRNGRTFTRFSMSDAGSFLEKTTSESDFEKTLNWRLINDNSETRYDHTEIKNGSIYDMIYFYTEWNDDSADHARKTYLVQDRATEEVFMIYSVDNTWYSSASWGANYSAGEIQFDTDTYTIHLPNKNISVNLLQENEEEHLTKEAVIIEGYMYINRTSQKIDYMYDSTRNTTITFINDVASFETPSMYNEGSAPDLLRVSDYYAKFTQDVTRYCE